MKTKTIEWWNKLPKDNDTDVTAIEGDSVAYINGVAFLIQRKNNWNNIVCWKVKPSKKNIVEIFCSFRAWLEKNKIQFVRVEGIGKHHYKMLYLVMRKSNFKMNVIYDEEESSEFNRHIWYAKTY